MKAKVIFGYIFIAIASVLSLSVLAQLPKHISTIVRTFSIFNSEIDSETKGYYFGGTLFICILLVAIFFLWKYGIKWTKEKR